MLFVTLFFESICFPTIVALGIRGLGRHSKRGSGFIIGGVIGGGCVPALTGKVAEIYNDTGIAMVVPMAFMIAAFTYPVCVNFVPYYKGPADALTVNPAAIDEYSSGSGSDSPQILEGPTMAKAIDGAQIREIEKIEAARF